MAAMVFRVKNGRKTAGRPLWFEKKRMLNSHNYKDFLTSLCFLAAVAVAECFFGYFSFLSQKKWILFCSSRDLHYLCRK